ncbi:hypothetical protein SAMN05444166_5997 [Singulisphaera sp. GP187]|uniref:hypothetical protein n=1 Tax=Singulisphaera sp. GP187 TaxID=1882752 RepID=UPI000928B592|nr:hypothetical protein [Singulisphaera sp. GP187]SIO59302.1 hypothetical protein SAMN05444166_5997 [Singulisphaera sp. GP187]
MNHPKSDRRENDGFSNAAVSQEQDRINGRRSLERMGLISFERLRRNPYWELDILGLMRGPEREDRLMNLAATDDRDGSEGSRELPWAEESPRSAPDPERLLL